VHTSVGAASTGQLHTHTSDPGNGGNQSAPHGHDVRLGSETAKLRAVVGHHETHTGTARLNSGDGGRRLVDRKVQTRSPVGLGSVEKGHGVTIDPRKPTRD
jgi:hypothetical protein